MIFGIDVSKWQGIIEWNKVASAGVKYTFVKATEGVGYVDPMLKSNVQGALAAGLKAGLYHFLRVDNPDPVAEAAHFIQTIRGMQYDWIVCDIEDAKGKSSADVVSYTRTWLQEVEQATGKRPIVYTYVSFANQYLKDSLAAWPLWIAHYNSQGPGSTAWADWICWQYTDSGTVDGIAGNVDCNWMTPEFFAGHNNTGGDRMPNWTDSQWTEFAAALNGLYYKSVNNELDRPVLWNYNYVTKAYTRTLTVDEIIWLLGIMFAASQRVSV
jgi:GH25 family lysozyme M1 (1,4-beta-N-acetylmuramidase)